MHHRTSSPSHLCITAPLNHSASAALHCIILHDPGNAALLLQQLSLRNKLPGVRQVIIGAEIGCSVRDVRIAGVRVGAADVIHMNTSLLL